MKDIKYIQTKKSWTSLHSLPSGKGIDDDKAGIFMFVSSCDPFLGCRL